MPTLESDLKKVMKLIPTGWKRQNNEQDEKTKFIYTVNSLENCLIEIDRTGVDKSYALHRWYNLKTSIRCEEIFCEYGAIHETDRYNHDVDIYINGIPFDVKLSVYPAALSHRPYDLTTRVGKDDLIRWFYANQSQESRKQLLNRLYVVCDAPTSRACMDMKSDFELMRKKIDEFMKSAVKDGVNQITITDNGRDYALRSDIIHLR